MVGKGSMASIGLIYGSRFEDIDHMAPLMEILGLPLFVTDEKILEIKSTLLLS
jgi:hypothetical protein